MPYQVLYRTYRPARFSEVVGQDFIIRTLKNAIKSNKIAHAYLFAGPRGTGKTTIAKLFAKAINCESFDEESCDSCKNCLTYVENNHPDIIELDAASNNGVDDVREIIEQAQYAPLMGKYKVYIIDEVHMLTASAFNALLKTLEEPPAHVVFILATTDPQKVIPTVLSRCQRYNFAKISTFEIKKKTSEILNKENIPFEEKAVEEIARMAEGGMRDALSILEQCLAYNPDELKLEDIEHIFGLTSTPVEVELYCQIHQNNVSEVVQKVRGMYQRGMDTKRLAIDLMEIIKDALIYSDSGKDTLLNKINAIEAQQILSEISIDELLADAKDLEDALSRERQNQNFLAYFELCLVRMANNNQSRPATIKKAEKPEPKAAAEEKAEVPVVEKEKTIAEQPVPQEKQEDVKVETDKSLLLRILLDASRDLKISDQIIYNRLDLYRYEADKRKFYQLLIGTELFASNKDAIIIVGNRSQADNINARSNNEDLYRFLNEEFGMDKMVFAIDTEEKNELVSMYRQTPPEERNKPVYIEKYVTEKTTSETKEEKLFSVFGDALKVEE